MPSKSGKRKRDGGREGGREGERGKERRWRRDSCHKFQTNVLLSFRVRDATRQGDRMTKAHKRLADSLIGVSAYVALLPIGSNDPLSA